MSTLVSLGSMALITTMPNISDTNPTSFELFQTYFLANSTSAILHALINTLGVVLYLWFVFTLYRYWQFMQPRQRWLARLGLAAGLVRSVSQLYSNILMFGLALRGATSSMNSEFDHFLYNLFAPYRSVGGWPLIETVLTTTLLLLAGSIVMLGIKGWPRLVSLEGLFGGISGFVGLLALFFGNTNSPFAFGFALVWVVLMAGLLWFWGINFGLLLRPQVQQPTQILSRQGG